MRSGTQAIRLARRGCDVTGVDPSEALLSIARADASNAHVQVGLLRGGIAELASCVGERTFDTVCAHGLLMYLPDADAALATLAARVGSGGLLSVTCRNAAALAFRPGVRRDWAGAVAAFGTRSYRNELGVEATAHDLDDVLRSLRERGLTLEAWYGVRVFTETASASEQPDPATFAALLEAESSAGRTDPYRHLASQLHVLARRDDLPREVTIRGQRPGRTSQRCQV